MTIGVITIFNCYRNTSDPIDWELFRSAILCGQEWQLERMWSPRLFRDLESEKNSVSDRLIESSNIDYARVDLKRNSWCWLKKGLREVDLNTFFVVS